MAVERKYLDLGRLAKSAAAAIAFNIALRGPTGAPPTARAFAPPETMAGTGQSRRRAGAASFPLSGAVAAVDERMAETYDVLAKRLIDRYGIAEASSGGLRNEQLFVCVAGGPGSGKSTLSAAVAGRINEQMGVDGAESNSGGSAVVLPMDGFHYSRSRLKSMGESPNAEYTYEELLARRGAPWTFDAEGCIAAFIEARKNGEASLPVYIREKSDPVPGGVHLNRTTKIVLLEGNYLLAWGDERWKPLQTHEVFDETWYISCQSLEDQRERLVKRHLETWSEEKTRMFGEGSIGAGKKADSNDMLNLEWIDAMSREYADLVIESV